MIRLQNISKLGCKVLENRALPPFVLGKIASIQIYKMSKMNAKV